MDFQEQLDDLQALNEVLLEDETKERDGDDAMETDGILWWREGIQWCRKTG